MHLTRRNTLVGLASFASLSLINQAHAATEGSKTANNMISGMNGDIEVHPIQHASLALKGAGKVIYADPVGDLAAYKKLSKPDLILITHEHGDHYNAETLGGLLADNTQILANPAVFEKLPTEIKARTKSVGNGDNIEISGVSISAIPAYNITEDRKKYHPEGRDNGYVLMLDGKRIYIAGDTEDTSEMRALKDIDLAFLPMNLPYTMDITQAADAVGAFAPRVVYPYHHKGSDVAAFKTLVENGPSNSQVRIVNWY